MYLLEITGQDILIAAAFMFFIAIAWLLAEFHGMKEAIRERMGINNEAMKLKLQAYERLTLYAERAGLKNLVSGNYSESQTVGQMQLTLLTALKTEYEYNVSQQIYVSPEMWKAINKLKDQNTFIINQIAATLPSDAPGMNLSKAILEYSMTDNAELNKIVLDALQFEAKKLLK